VVIFFKTQSAQSSRKALKEKPNTFNLRKFV